MGSMAVMGSVVGLQGVYKGTEFVVDSFQKAEIYYRQKPRLKLKRERPEDRMFDLAPHFPAALACTGVALAFGNLSRVILRDAPLIVKSFCGYGMISSIGGLFAAMSVIATFAALGNGHAVFCKRVCPNDPKAARLRHQACFLYRVPFVF